MAIGFGSAADRRTIGGLLVRPTTQASESPSFPDDTGSTATVTLHDLPPEAAETAALIDQGGPFPYPDQADPTFSHRERLLPDQPEGYYQEYTVETPGYDDRGARRIGGTDGELYSTDDHYESFSRIER